MKRTSDIEMAPETIASAVAFLRILDNKYRLALLRLLHKHGPLCVTAIRAKVKLPQAETSFNLGKLRKAGFVSTSRNRQEIHYSVCYERLEEVNGIIKKFL